VQSAIQGNAVKRPWFGAKLQRVTPDIAESLGLDRPAGALIKLVKKNSPAAQSLLRAGDVIVEVNGKQVADPRAFRYRFSTKKIGGSVPLGILRQARLITVTVPLREAPEIPRRNVTILKGHNPFAGVSVANLSPALAEELSIDEESYGVIVLKVTPGTPASDSNFLRSGDIIVAANGQRIKLVKQLSQILFKPTRQWRVSVKRNGRILNVVIEG
jgi:S1-C subfamily serine protease